MKRIFSIKYILPLLIMVILPVFLNDTAAAKDKTKEREIKIIKDNRISEMTEFDIDISTGERVKKSVSVFDKNGLKKEVSEFKTTGALEKRVEYTYETDSNELTCKDYNIDGLLLSSRESHYDNKDKKLSKEAFFDAKNLLLKVRTYTYDDRQNPVEHRMLDKDGKLMMKTANSFNEEGFKTVTSIYGADEKLTAKWEYKYDENKNLTEAVSYDKDNKMTGKWVYEYDKKKLLTSLTGFNSKNAATLSKKYEYERFKIEPKPDAGPREVMTFRSHAEASAMRSETGEDISPQNFIASAEYGTPDELAQKLEAGKFDINYQTESGWTALIAASFFGNADAVEFLLSRGADMNLKDTNGKTALDHARMSQHKNVIKLLTGGGGK